MSFKIEDGTGISDATSYASVAEFRAYWTDRGVDTTSIVDAVVQNLLIKATDYIGQRWGMSFLGYREFECQALDFPRLALYNRDGRAVEGVPAKLKYATFEYAYKLNTEELFPDVGDRTQQVISQRDKVGPLETETRYSESSVSVSSAPIKPFPAADRYLAEYILPGGRTDRA